jgi:hypothetical protein
MSLCSPTDFLSDGGCNLCFVCITTSSILFLRPKFLEPHQWCERAAVFLTTLGQLTDIEPFCHSHSTLLLTGQNTNPIPRFRSVEQKLRVIIFFISPVEGRGTTFQDLLYVLKQTET